MQQLRSWLPKVLIGLAIVAMVGRGVMSFLPSAPSKKPPVPAAPVSALPAGLQVPDFQADSAFVFLKKQVDFGPRVPNTPAHKKCAAWFASEFRRLGLTVIEQKFTAKHYKGTTFDCVNIIAQYKPEAARRLLFTAHWDSRFVADKDTRDTLKPIDGADDGASGVAVLLEMARLLQATPADVGVDFILFDAEDQGEDQGGGADTWCLGSQYWSKNLHRGGYQPYYALLLDMVGAKGARFAKEGISMEVAPGAVNRVWAIAKELGYGQYFSDVLKPGITDDHLYVIRNAGIQMIDIISMPNDGDHLFGDYHHTHKDNISVIDKNVLKAVGQTCTALVYASAPVM